MTEELSLPVIGERTTLLGTEALRNHFGTLLAQPPSRLLIVSAYVTRLGVEWLCEHYDVFAVTAATEFRNSLRDKLDWLDEHFPFIGWQRLVLCGDKRIIQADYMIDDHAWNLESFKGKGLLFTASHNTEEERFMRVDNWEEVRAFFEGELLNAG